MPVYRDPASGRTIRTTDPLSPDQIADIFNPPQPLSAKFPAVKPSLGAVQTSLATPEARSTARGIAGTITRVGGSVGGAMLGHPFIGGALADAAARAVEGAPQSLVASGLSGIYNRFAPGIKGSIPAGVAKGAAFGAGSATLDSIVEGKGIPPVGRLAVGGLTGGILLGLGRKFLRPSIYELSHSDVAGDVDKILAGDITLLKESAGVREGLQEIREALPHVNKVALTTRPGEVRPGVYRTRIGRFSALEPEPAGPSEFQRGLEPEIIEQPPLFPERQLEKLNEVERLFGGNVRGLYVGVPKGWFSRVQHTTNIPVYDEVYRPVETAHVRRIEFDRARANDLKDVYQGVHHSGREKYQAFLEATDRDSLADKLQLKVGDRIRLTKLQNTWEQLFKGYGLEDGALRGATTGPTTRAEQHLQETLPRLRASKDMLENATSDLAEWKDIVENAYPVDRPAALQFFGPAFESGSMGVGDTDSLGIITRHMNHGSYQTFVAPSVNAARAKYVTPFLSHVSGSFREDFRGVASTTNHYLNQIHGSGDPTGHDLALFVHSMAKRLRIPMGRTNARDLSNMIIASQYSATMGWRPGPLIRNMTQTMQTGFSELGPKYWANGVRLALTKRGQELATRLGINEGEAGAIHEITSGIATSKIQKITHAMGGMLSKNKDTDDANRTIMGLGQWSRAMWAMKKAKGDVNKFIDLSWIDSDIFHPAEQEALQKVAKSGNFTEAARLSAIALADNTQWVYRSGNRPPVMTGTAGRAFGGFGTWSSFYGNYLGRIIPRGASARRTAVWGAGRPISKNAIRFSRFILANAAMVGTAAELGKLVGNEDNWKRALSWNAFGALAYTGSPIAKETQELMSTAQELAQGTIGGPHLKQFGKGLATFIPGAYLAKDFAHLANPDKGPGEAILRTMGIQPRLMR